MKIILIVLVLLLMLPFATLLKNQVPLFKAPGLISRVSVYLTSNAAVTADVHDFPELITPVFKARADELFNTVEAAVNALGWQIQAIDRQNLRIEIVITSPVFRFKDDMVVQIQAIDGNKTTLNIASRSRIGRADFAANEAHILRLINAVAADDL